MVKVTEITCIDFTDIQLLVPAGHARMDEAPSNAHHLGTPWGD